MKILVIIVTYNGIKWIKKCLDSVNNSTIPLDTYIIDNGSSDGTQSFIKENYTEVFFFQSNTNLGFGKANNIGLQYAIDNNYDYVYLLNQDAWILPDTIEKLVTVSRLYPEYGVLSPIQMQKNMNYMDKNFSIIVGRTNQLLSDLFTRKLNDVYEVSHTMAAHWLISNKCLRIVGGFSPTFPHYGEDDNYTNRLLFHNFMSGIVPNAIGIHDREERVESKEKKKYLQYIGMLVLLSNIDNNKISLKKILFRLLKTSLNFGPFASIKIIVNILTDINNIRRNRIETMKPGAFLNI